MKGVKTRGSILGVGDGGGGPILKHNDMLPEHDKYYEKLWIISQYIIKTRNEYKTNVFNLN